MPSPRKPHPLFSLILTNADGSVATLRDFGSAVSRTIQVHVPATQLPPPLLPPPSPPPTTSSSSSPRLQAPLLSPLAASSSPKSQPVGTIDARFGGQLAYSANYAAIGAGDSREVGTVEDRQPASGPRVGIFRRFAVVFLALYRKLRRVGVYAARRRV